MGAPAPPASTGDRPDRGLPIWIDIGNTDSLLPFAVDGVHEDPGKERAGIHRLRRRMGAQALPTGNRLGFLWVVLPPDRNRRQPHDRAVSSRTVARRRFLES
jgi:hypothetical protein